MKILVKKSKILMKNKKLDEKLKFWWKMRIVIKNENFDDKWKIWWKRKNLTKNVNFDDKTFRPENFWKNNIQNW